MEKHEEHNIRSASDKKVIANCMFVQVLRPTYNGPLSLSFFFFRLSLRSSSPTDQGSIVANGIQASNQVKRTNLNLKRSDLVVVSMVWELVEVNVVCIFGK